MLLKCFEYMTLLVHTSCYRIVLVHHVYYLSADNNYKINYELNYNVCLLLLMFLSMALLQHHVFIIVSVSLSYLLYSAQLCIIMHVSHWPPTLYCCY